MCKARECRPGKFVGEPCITKLMYHWSTEGVLDYIADGPEGWEPHGPWSTAVLLEAKGPFVLSEIVDASVAVCDECLDDILHATSIYFFEDDSGFAYSDVQGDNREV